MIFVCLCEYGESFLRKKMLFCIAELISVVYIDFQGAGGVHVFTMQWLGTATVEKGEVCVCYVWGVMGSDRQCVLQQMEGPDKIEDKNPFW